jgi:uncharacterized protein (TIGR03084 family)
MSDVIADLIEEGNEIDALVADLGEAGWDVATPAEGWTVAHQIAHLSGVCRLAALAASDAQGFGALTSRLSPDFDANVRALMAPYLAEPKELLLTRFRTERAAAEQALAAVPPGELVPWLVRPLHAPVLAMAGMMELFAHGQDIADGLGIERVYTDRIGHITAFGVRVWDFGYLSRGLATPEAEFRFELVAPSGQVWAFGPPDAANRISGPALDFCLLVSRRRHRDDLALVASGEEADKWLDLAQAYRGPAGPGRQPGQFKK